MSECVREEREVKEEEESTVRTTVRICVCTCVCVVYVLCENVLCVCVCVLCVVCACMCCVFLDRQCTPSKDSEKVCNPKTLSFHNKRKKWVCGQEHLPCGTGNPQLRRRGVYKRSPGVTVPQHPSHPENYNHPEGTGAAPPSARHAQPVRHLRPFSLSSSHEEAGGGQAPQVRLPGPAAGGLILAAAAPDALTSACTAKPSLPRVPLST